METEEGAHKCVSFVAGLPGFRVLGKSCDFSVPQCPPLQQGPPPRGPYRAGRGLGECVQLRPPVRAGSRAWLGVCNGYSLV